MDAWQENNNSYLEISLQWLRLRLQRLIPEARRESANRQSPEEAAVAPDAGPVSRFSHWRRSPTAKKATPLLTEGHPPSLDEQIQVAEAKRAEVAQMDPPPALMMLSERFGLSEFERDTLFLCAAMEFDPGLDALYCRAQNHASRNYATFGLAMSAFDNPSWDALSAQRPLRFARLIEISQPGAVALTSSAIRTDERIVNFIKGLNLLDDRLTALFQPADPFSEPVLSASQQSVVDGILRRLSQSATQSLLPVMQLAGADKGSRLAVSQAVSSAIHRRLYRVATEWLPLQTAEIELVTRLWQRESLLLPVALYVDAEDSANLSAEMSVALRRFLSRELGVVFVGVNENPINLSVPTFSIDVSKPTPAEQCDAWTRFLGQPDPATEPDQTAQLLAGQFNFSFSEIRQAAAMIGAAPEREEFSKRVWEVCRNLTRPNLDSLAQRLEPKATWEDLILPDEQMNLMRQIAGQVRERHKVYNGWGFARVMNRGFGISALFAGESGTGKTMAAEVIANDLQLNLYRIDLSAVVSKYIGETEKNLRKLFDAAERGGAILFFDEADALFGKRSEVKDSHDRYANIEINYLLQRMEAFSGLAILATNMKTALDSAFMRRLRFIVNLPFPGVKERMAIWQTALPAETPKKDLDYERLARLNLSGGNIHSIALNAAFIAAQNGQTVTMPILLTAARGELRKLEKGFSEAEFR
jgi:hypothetical protein